MSLDELKYYLMLYRRLLASPSQAVAWARCRTQVRWFRWVEVERHATAWDVNVIGWAADAVEGGPRLPTTLR